MAQAPQGAGVRITTRFDKSFTQAQMDAEAQRRRDHGATNVTVTKEPESGDWIISEDRVPPP